MRIITGPMEWGYHWEPAGHGWPQLGEVRCIVGHLPFEVKSGDEFHMEMLSGKIGRYRVLSSTREHDPPDMFWAQIKFVGYVGEPELEEVKAEPPSLWERIKRIGA